MTYETNTCIFSLLHNGSVSCILKCTYNRNCQVAGIPTSTRMRKLSQLFSKFSRAFLNKRRYKGGKHDKLCFSVGKTIFKKAALPCWLNLQNMKRCLRSGSFDIKLYEHLRGLHIQVIVRCMLPCIGRLNPGCVGNVKYLLVIPVFLLCRSDPKKIESPPVQVRKTV